MEILESILFDLHFVKNIENVIQMFTIYFRNKILLVLLVLCGMDCEAGLTILVDTITFQN